jgi:hypothetical protein
LIQSRQQNKKRKTVSSADPADLLLPGCYERLSEGTPNGLAGDPYNQTTIVILTADKGIEKRIQAAALSAGYSGDIINTQVIPSAMVNMGVENTSDTFCRIYPAISIRRSESRRCFHR